MMTDMPNDWVDDDSLSAEETMARFEALSPEPTRGPVWHRFQISTRVDATRSLGMNAVQATMPPLLVLV